MGAWYRPRMKGYTAKITERAGNHVTVEISHAGEVLCEVTLRPDPALNGALAPWGSWANWCSDPAAMIPHETRIDEIVSAVRKAVAPR